MAILTAVAVIGGLCLVGFIGLWLLGWAIDRGIKDYIDYAKEDKERGSHRRT